MTKARRKIVLEFITKQFKNWDERRNFEMLHFIAQGEVDEVLSKQTASHKKKAT